MLKALVAALVLVVALFTGGPTQAQALPVDQVLDTWYRLTLELIRHTPTQTPPVASRALAYLGITGFEALASGSGDLRSLSGQLQGFGPVPVREAGVGYDEAAVLETALAATVQSLFANTGPTGQRSMKAVTKSLDALTAAGVAPEILARSTAYGQALAAHILGWAAVDGGAVVENMGFPRDYTLIAGPGHWVPTSNIVQQQAPLLPGWGDNRPFAMPSGATCDLPPPPAYSEVPGSDFHAEALATHDAVTNRTSEQTAVARFWSDDAMLSVTPPGHWISIALRVLDDQGADTARRAEVLAVLGVALADAFIGCWNQKYRYDLVRPVTYIRKVIDQGWEPLLNTPPFPEYPSGHSTQSGAAATVLTALIGDNIAFEDTTGGPDGLPARKFASFWAAAEEAGISRLYGGIHYPIAITNGLQQGRCIGAYAAALQTRKSQ